MSGLYRRVCTESLAPAPPGYPVGTGGCVTLPWPAAICDVTVSRLVQGVLPLARAIAALSDRHGKEGVAGSSPAEGSSQRFCLQGLSR
jgi:hypothetical protein